MTRHPLLFLTFVCLLAAAGCTAETHEPDPVPEPGAPSIAGERFELGCPEGERCDPSTSGAGFSGSFDIDGLSPTAVGGSQYISIVTLAEPLPASALTISSSDPAIFVVEEVVEVDDAFLSEQVGLPAETLLPQARIRGIGAGAAQLVVRNGDLLVDRLDVEVRELAEVEVVLFSDPPGTGFLVNGMDAAGDAILDREMAVVAEVPVHAMDECYFCFEADEPLTEPVTLTVTFAGVDHSVVAHR